MNTNAPLVNLFFGVINGMGEVAGKNVPTIIDLHKLTDTPEGSLAQAVVKFFKENSHLQPLTSGPRRLQLHDTVHVLTGYGTDAVGETEVQAFLLGSKFHLNHVVLGLGTLKLIRKQLGEVSPEVRQRLKDAYHRGTKSGFDIESWQPELYWNYSLERVQKQYNL